MGAPYSLDLRERAVAFATEHEELSQGQVAAFFRIGVATLQRWLREYRETGDLAPKPHTGGHDPLVSLERAELLASIVRRENDRTLEEYCRLLEEAGGPRLARSTMYDTLERLEITRKKKRSTQPRGTGRTSSRHEPSSGRRLRTSTPSATSSSTSRP
jgi:transposase